MANRCREREKQKAKRQRKRDRSNPFFFLLPSKENHTMNLVPYAQAIKRKYPEPVCLVTTIDEHGKPNVMTIGWWMLASVHPPMMAVSVARPYYSHGLIQRRREFVICFPGETMVEQVLICGAHSGRDTDKFAAARLTPQPATRVAPPLIAECMAAFECKLVAEVPAGDHTLFVGEVVASHVSEKAERRLFSLGGGKLGGL